MRTIHAIILTDAILMHRHEEARSGVAPTGPITRGITQMTEQSLALTGKQQRKLDKLKADLAELAAMQPYAHPATIKEYVRRALIESKLFTMRQVYDLTDGMVSK